MRHEHRREHLAETEARERSNRAVERALSEERSKDRRARHTEHAERPDFVRASRDGDTERVCDGAATNRDRKQIEDRQIARRAARFASHDAKLHLVESDAGACRSELQIDVARNGIGRGVERRGGGPPGDIECECNRNGDRDREHSDDGAQSVASKMPEVEGVEDRYMVNVVRAIGRWVVLIAAILVLLIELLGTLPAPTLPMLAFAVAVPEVAGRAVVIALVLILMVVAFLRGRMRVVGRACATIAFVLALIPLTQYPQANAKAEAELIPFEAGVATAHTPIARDATIHVERNLPVRTRDGAMLALDVYRSTIAGPRPTVITIYGGAWLFGKRADNATIDTALAARGYTAISVDYRHAPKYRFPTEPNDIQDAIATIAKHARAWGVDVDRVAVFGRSAGAELALLAAYAPEPVHVRAAVAYYAPTDLIDGYRITPNPDPADVRRILLAYLGAPPEGRMEGYRAASPVTHVRAGLPPTYLIIGLRDALVRPEQQRELRDTLRAHGDAVAAIELPWSNHAFDTIPGGLGGSLAMQTTDRFLRATLER